MSRTIEEVRKEITELQEQDGKNLARMNELSEIEKSDAELTDEQTTEFEGLLTASEESKAKLEELRTEEEGIQQAEADKIAEKQARQARLSEANQRHNSGQGRRVPAGHVGGTHEETRNASEPERIYIKPTDKEARMEQTQLDVGRIVRASALQQTDYRHMSVQDIAKNVLGGGGDGDEIGNRVYMAMSRGVATDGGSWIPDVYEPDIIELLKPRVVVRSMGATNAPLINGQLRLPKITQGASAAYVGENTNIAPSEMKSGSLNLNSKKLSALVPMSNDLIRFSNPKADMLVMDDLIRVMAVTEDAVFIRGVASPTAPTGIRNQAIAANVIAAVAGVTIQIVKSNLGKLRLALEESDVIMDKCGWIIAPRTRQFLEDLVDGNGNAAFPEVERGMLRGYPFATTTQMPTNLGGGTESEIIFANFTDVIIADSPTFELKASDVAAYHDGAAVVSAFSLDQTAVRCIAHNDIGVRHAEAIAVMTGVTWGA